MYRTGQPRRTGRLRKKKNWRKDSDVNLRCVGSRLTTGELVEQFDMGYGIHRIPTEILQMSKIILSYKFYS